MHASTLETLSIIIDLTNKAGGRPPLLKDVATVRATSHQNVSSAKRELQMQGYLYIMPRHMPRNLIPTEKGRSYVTPATLQAPTGTAQDAVRAGLAKVSLPCAVTSLREACRGTGESLRPMHEIRAAARDAGVQFSRSAHRCKGCHTRHYLAYTAPIIERQWKCQGCLTESVDSN